LDAPEGIEGAVEDSRFDAKPVKVGSQAGYAERRK
jgi:hypothetical protein